ncbi:MAG: signal recognition particle-docking protein FtsY [Candidatus Marinimicrobia bacterium]|nr:signal recognition particle-docking protein FtsY [Candidatus Neomarinimicrobiota bacterium]
MAIVGKLFNALSRTRANLTTVVSAVLNKRISAELIEELEEVLLTADIGVQTVEALSATLQRNSRRDFLSTVKETLLKILPDGKDAFQLPAEPTVLMVVGVNGTGKTTSVAKLAAYYDRLGRKVLLIGADTYRAAAVEQLKIWSNRLGIRLVCNELSADPSSVLFDGLTSAQAAGSDLVIVDTAGRLHTYDNLMAELNKMYAVVSKRFNSFNLRSLITIDATLGQNSLQQAKTFAARVRLDGAVITKLDGTAKGGIVFPLYQELGLPTVFIGVGEQLDDLYRFDSREYVNSLFDPATD